MNLTTQREEYQNDILRCPVSYGTRYVDDGPLCKIQSATAQSLSTTIHIAFACQMCLPLPQEFQSSISLAHAQNSVFHHLNQVWSPHESFLNFIKFNTVPLNLKICKLKEINCLAFSSLTLKHKFWYMNKITAQNRECMKHIHSLADGSSEIQWDTFHQFSDQGSLLLYGNSWQHLILYSELLLPPHLQEACGFS